MCRRDARERWAFFFEEYFQRRSFLEPKVAARTIRAATSVSSTRLARICGVRIWVLFWKPLRRRRATASSDARKPVASSADAVARPRRRRERLRRGLRSRSTGPTRGWGASLPLFSQRSRHAHCDSRERKRERERWRFCREKKDKSISRRKRTWPRSPCARPCASGAAPSPADSHNTREPRSFFAQRRGRHGARARPKALSTRRPRERRVPRRLRANKRGSRERCQGARYASRERRVSLRRTRPGAVSETKSRAGPGSRPVLDAAARTRPNVSSSSSESP